MTYKHVQTIRSVGLDRVERTYHYHRKAKMRFESEPGTAAFAEEYARIESGALTPKRAQRSAEYVYFLQALIGGPVKIGKAADPTARLEYFQRAYPYHLQILGVIAGGADHLERELHRRFAASRLLGEWFEPTDELINFIRESAPRFDDENDAGTGL